MILTKRRTPTLAEITFAGENICENKKWQIIGKVARLDLLVRYLRLELLRTRRGR